MAAGHASRAHARFSPSQAARLLACPGSAALCDTVPPPPSSDAADQGTAAHELLEIALSEWLSVEEAYQARLTRNPGARRLDHVDLDAVAVAVTEVRRLAVDLLGTHDLLCETRVRPFPDLPDFDGTCDALLIGPDTIHVIDYKHGAGVVVDADDNAQLLQYALGAHARWGAGVKEYHLTIIQPRAPDIAPVRTQVVTAAQVEAHAFTLLAGWLAAQDPDAPRVPGEKQCRWCAACHICPEAQRSALAVANVSLSGKIPIRRQPLPDPNELDAKRLAQILDGIPLLQNWIRSVQGAALRTIVAGTAVPGYKAVEGFARRKWLNGEMEAAVELASMLELDNVDLLLERKLPTLQKIEHMLTVHFARKQGVTRLEAKADADIALASLMERAYKGIPALAPADDRRPTFNRANPLLGIVKKPQEATHD